MIRLSIRFTSALALIALVLSVFPASAQQDVPAAPVAQVPSLPATPAPAPVAPVFPKTDPANFTAASPSQETVNAFMQANWGLSLIHI